MSARPSNPGNPAIHHPGASTFILVWLALVVLTFTLVVLSHFGPRTAVWGLLTVSPIKAALVFYYFMHLKYEGPLLKGIMVVALGTLLISLALLFADVAFA